jgi:hypothetical protein
VLSSQNPMTVRRAIDSDVSPPVADATCGAASRNASGGNQTHVR